jgi:hypothetical protein
MQPVPATQREERAREITGKVPIVAVTGGVGIGGWSQRERQEKMSVSSNMFSLRVKYFQSIHLFLSGKQTCEICIFKLERMSKKSSFA